MAIKEPTAVELECRARELCIEGGGNPDQITGMSFMPPHVLLWMTYKQMAWASLQPRERRGSLPASHPFKAPRP